MSAPVIVDAAGAQMGGAARYLDELRRYLDRTGRDDVAVIGSGHRISPSWLIRRELAAWGRDGRRVALNNIGFSAPGGERWTLLRNALHFLTDGERACQDPALLTSLRRETPVVHRAARQSHLLVVPSTAMAARVIRQLPRLRARVAVRPHPVSAGPVPCLPREPVILCPVLFAPYKRMASRLTELLTALEEYGDTTVRVRVTADEGEVPVAIAGHPQVDLVGRRGHAELREMQARSRVIYFPTELESFGWPLAEARVSGRAVIACDTAHNREIAGPALCGFTRGDTASLRWAIGRALTARIPPDPGPFDPDAYFGWLLGLPR